jgi:hypothetical protein
LISLLVLVILVVVVVLITQKMKQDKADAELEGSSGPVPRRSALRPAPSLTDDLDRWVAAGLLAPDQAKAILEHESARPAPEVLTPPSTAAAVHGPSSRFPVVAEALGYLGGVLALTGLVLVLVHYWPDLAWAGRVTLTGVGAAALTAGGFAVRDQADPALVRLRAFLWLLSSAVTAVFVGVLVTEDRDLADQTAVFWCSAAVAVQSGLLWRWRERPVQQIVALGGLTVAVGTGVSLVAGDAAAGVALWALGLGYLALGLTRRTPAVPLTELVAAVALLAGGPVMLSASMSAGLLVALATVVGLLGVVSTTRLELQLVDRLVLGVPAVVVGLQLVPSALVYFANDAGVLTGLLTWMGGALLLVVAARDLSRFPVPTELLGGLTLLAGAALTGMQWESFAPVFGLGTALGLVVLGMRPGRVLLSLVGALGLLIFVPWAVAELFPGEGRAPLLIMVAGAVLVGVAVLLARQGDRFRHDLSPPPSPRVEAKR